MKKYSLVQRIELYGDHFGNHTSISLAKFVYGLAQDAAHRNDYANYSLYFHEIEGSDIALLRSRPWIYPEFIPDPSISNICLRLYVENRLQPGSCYIGVFLDRDEMM